MNNQDKIFNEILRESSEDTKYKPMEESFDMLLYILAALIAGVIIGIIITFN